MADLTWSERNQIEKLFDMQGGYVLDFSNNTLADFVEDVVHWNIYDARYNHGRGSKANRLRAFWNVESNQVVAKLLEALLDHQIANALVHEQKAEPGARLARSEP